MLHTVLETCRELLEADTATVLLLDPSQSFIETVAATGVETAVARRFRVPLGAGFAGTIASTRQPRRIDGLRRGDVVNPYLIQRGLVALVGVPLHVGDELIGVLHVGRTARRPFTDADTALLVALAEPIAEAIRWRLADEQNAAAEALQRSLVPDRLPTIPGLTMAARYIPAAGNIGGDWYDVFRLPGERIGIVMGDVAGHGLEAAIVMGRLRSALRSYALLFEDPAEVLQSLDRKAQHFEAGIMATVLYATIAPPYDRITVSLAGHLAPAVSDDVAGRGRSLPIKPDLPIGVDVSATRSSHTVPLEAGTCLCTFTDGLVERRPQPGANVEDPIGPALDAVLGALKSADPASVCDLVLDAALNAAPATDDIALLVLQREPVGE